MGLKPDHWIRQMARELGKSTYIRCGIIVNVTPFEPEWEGHITLEISNTTPLPAKIYAGEGIAQVLSCLYRSVKSLTLIRRGSTRANSPSSCPGYDVDESKIPGYNWSTGG